MLFLALNAVDMLLIHSLCEILHAHEYISGMFESQSYCRPIFLPSIIFFRDEFPRMATIKHNKMYTYEFWKVAGNRAQMLNTCYVNFFHPHRTHTMDVPKNSSSVLCFDVLLDFDAIRAGILELCANSETMMILWPNIQCWRWRRACGR